MHSELRNRSRHQTGRDQNVIFITDKAGQEDVAKVKILHLVTDPVGNHRQQKITCLSGGRGFNSALRPLGKSLAGQVREILLPAWGRVNERWMEA